MNRFWQDRTARHLAILLALKFSLLAALWWDFVRDARLELDGGRVAEAVLRAAPALDLRRGRGAWRLPRSAAAGAPTS